MTAVPPGAVTADMAKLAYDTWQSARGVPGASTWDMMPDSAKAGWEATARAVAAAERERIRQLAEQRDARYHQCNDVRCEDRECTAPFADLLRDGPS